MQKIWTKHDIPTPQDVADYLSRIASIRRLIFGAPGLPELPENLEHIMLETANDLERILLAADGAIDRIPDSWAYAGEFDSGGF